MPENPEAPNGPSPEQLRRAEALRRKMDRLGAGKRSPPRTPRELTDDAAREEWERERSGDKGPSRDR